MNQETYNALLESIAHWERIRDWKDTEWGPKQCALCQLFYKYTEENSCILCPVRERSGQVWCRGTPYAHFVDYTKSNLYDIPEGTYSKLAQAEVDFLKSLLPSESERTQE